jgi:hypothetical protein
VPSVASTLGLRPFANLRGCKIINLYFDYGATVSGLPAFVLRYGFAEYDVPRFRFNIRDGSNLIHEDEGRVLPDIESARDEARVSARELTRQKYREPPPLDGRTIEITDIQGRIIETLSVRSVLY